MYRQTIRFSAVLLLVLTVAGLFPTDADAQRRRRRRARTVQTPPRPVITNPEIAEPGAEGDPSSQERVISTAEETAAEAEAIANEAADQKKKPAATKSSGENPNIQKTIDALSEHVNVLNERLTRMQENDRSLLDLERLTRAEQRSENLRNQQLDVETKLADQQSKLEQVEYALKPENIERDTAGYGTTRPEEARAMRRRQLESERSRLQAQIRILETSRVRLEAAVRTSDAEVDLLRRRLEQNRQLEEAGATQTEAPASTNRRRPEQ